MEVLPEMARSLPDGVELVIVDNGPEDELRHWAQAAGHKLIVPKKNIGFGAGCNLGASRCKTEFIFFLNPDVRLQPDTLHTLLTVARDHPSAAAFGPEFSNEIGASFRYRPSRILRRGDRMVRASRPSTTIRVPSLNGAGLLCRRSAFEKVGGFDENLFLFFEDDDLSLRLASEVGPLYYVPEAKAFHALGRSSPSSDTIQFLKGYHYVWSHAYVLRKFGHRFPGLVPFLGVLRRHLSTRMLKSPAYRANVKGRLHGALDVRNGKGWQDEE